MHPPFTTEQFLDVFRRYNEAVWPAQFALLAIGVITAAMAYRGERRRARASLLLLAALWLWTGIVYFKTFFTTLATNAGEIFGSLFIAEAGLLVLSAWQREEVFQKASRPARITGGALLVYALVLYPAIGAALGHHYPGAPSFGAPCPATIFTFGIFCLLPTAIPRFALAIPILWTAIGSSAAFSFGMREDLGMIVAAIAAIVVIHHETHHRFLPRLAV